MIDIEEYSILSHLVLILLYAAAATTKLYKDSTC